MSTPEWLRLPTDGQAALATVRRIATEVRQQAREGAMATQPGAKRRWLSVTILTVWLVGLCGDAVTTSLAMRSGIAHEANPLAGHMFAAVGMEVWMALGAVVMTYLAMLTLTKPRHVVLYPFVAGMGALLLIKLSITVNNLSVLFIGMHS